MVNELRTMLHESVRVPPEDDTDVTRLLQAGRRRVRRRRVSLAVTVAAVAVCAGVTPALVGLVGTTGGPAAGTGPVGPVVSLADARPAVEGRDYEVVTTLVNENLDFANGQHFADVTPDGLIVVRDGPHGIRNRLRWGLLDPADDETVWLPEPGGSWQPESLVEAGARRLLFVSEAYEGGFTVWSYDRDAEAWSDTEVTAPALGITGGNTYLAASRLGPENRLYVSITVDEQLEQSRLWSVALDDPDDVREEGLVGDWDLEDGELTFTESSNEPSSTIHVRDLRTGEERTFDAQSGSRCNALGMDRVGGLIAFAQYCGESGGRRDDRVQVITTDGAPVVTVQDDGVDLVEVTERFVVVRAYPDGRAGAYAYEPATGRFLRLGEGHVKFGGSHTGRGDLLTWATPVNRGHGMKIWAGRFR
jgi:hypothetical protein